MQIRSRTLGTRKLNFRSMVLKGVSYSILVILAITTIYPFLWMVSTSFKQEQYVFEVPPRLIPDPWIWDNYPYIFSTMPFGLFVYNSFKLSTLSAIGNLLSCALAAYAFARLRFRGKEIIFIAVLATMMLPSYVTMIPVYLVMFRIGWLDTHLALWVPSFFGSGYGIFLIRQYFLSLPSELMDAARIDGCSHLGVLFRIMLPLATPVLATLALLTFMGNWNALLQPVLYLNSEEKFTLTIALTRFRGLNQTYWTKMMAGSTVSLVPILILFILTQKYFVQSVVLTGLRQ